MGEPEEASREEPMYPAGLVTAEVVANDARDRGWSATAFLISPTLAVTAARPAKSARGNRKEKVKLRFPEGAPEGGEQTARVVARHLEAGYALLRLERAMPFDAPAMAAKAPSPGADWHALPARAAAPLEGRVLAVNEGESGLLRLGSPGGAADRAEGAPVIIDGAIAALLWKRDGAEWLAVPMPEIRRGEAALSSTETGPVAVEEAASDRHRAPSKAEALGAPAPASMPALAISPPVDETAAAVAPPSPPEAEAPIEASRITGVPEAILDEPVTQDAAPLVIEDAAPSARLAAPEPDHSPALESALGSSASACVRWALSYASASGASVPVDAALLLAGVMRHGEHGGGAAQALLDHLGHDGRAPSLGSALELLRASFYELASVPERPSETLSLRPLTDDVRGLVELAAAHARSTAADGRVHVRHLAAALLVGPVRHAPLHERPLGIVLGDRLGDLTTALHLFIRRVHGSDALEAWRDIFGVERAASLAVAAAAYAPDVADGPDLLGIDVEVEALASLIAATNVEPPLAVALLGGAGSGRSYFLGALGRRVDAMANQARSEGEDGPSRHCRRVVQVDFNPWHRSEGGLRGALAEQVVGALESALGGAAENSDEVRAALRGKLPSALRRAEALSRTRREAERRVEELDRRLATVGDEVKDAETKLSDLRATDLINQLRSEVKVSQRVAAAMEALGLPSRTVLPAELAEQLRELRTLSGRIGVLWTWLYNANGWVVGGLLALPFAVGVAIALVLRVVMPEFEHTASLAGALLASVAELSLWLKQGMAKVAGAVGKLEEAKREVERLGEEKRRKLGQDEVVQRRRIDRAVAEEQALRAARQEALARMTADADALEEVRAGRGALGGSDEGADLREDMERLSALLGDARHERAPGLPRIDRVLVRVDDLDRCSDERAAEALEALHVVCGMPPFVTIVAADPERLARAAAGRGALLDKAIQIPFRLHAGDGAPIERILVGAAGGSSSLPARSGATRMPVALAPQEIAGIARLGAFCPSPRAAKRLVNVYRVLRALVPDEEVERFLGDEHGGQHRAALLLLAVQLVRPAEARTLQVRLAARDASSRLEPLLDELAATEGGAWPALRASLVALGRGDEPIAAYRAFAPRVARFEFPSRGS